MQRAVLIDLLLTRVLVFVSSQFGAIPSVVIDLLLLATLELAIRDAAAEDAERDEAADTRSDRPAEPPALDGSLVDARTPAARESVPPSLP
jgi:hypothetical protein